MDGAPNPDETTGVRNKYAVPTPANVFKPGAPRNGSSDCHLFTSEYRPDCRVDALRCWWSRQGFPASLRCVGKQGILASQRLHSSDTRSASSTHAVLPMLLVPSLCPKFSVSRPRILPSSVADLQPEFGEQLLFVHFIPPSLRKLGKEKVPWIVHTTGAPVICREALHVHFRGVRNFETHEGVATGARCQCMIAQHHLRGFGCLRWEDGVAIIEPRSGGARIHRVADRGIDHSRDADADRSRQSLLQRGADR